MDTDGLDKVMSCKHSHDSVSGLDRFLNGGCTAAAQLRRSMQLQQRPSGSATVLGDSAVSEVVSEGIFMRLGLKGNNAND